MRGRHQCVQVESAFSPFLPIKWGIPQGSILGPIIFLIFINELPAVVEDPNDTSEDVTVVVFADDNTPMFKHANPDILQEKLEQIARKITNWFHSNQMIVSGEKTKLLVIGTSSNRKSKLGDRIIKLIVDGHETEECESEKLLGLVINQFGTWKNHLHGDGGDNKGLLKDLSKRVGMLKQLRKNLSISRFKMLISGLFSSKLI